MFYFRDKGQGWSYNNKIIYNNGKEKKINHRLSSYMTYFLRGDTYRDSCHKCPYAKPKRCADITVGDFWGILKVRPDLNKEIDIEKGGQWDGIPFAAWAENGAKFTYNVKSRGLHCYRHPPEGEEET